MCGRFINTFHRIGMITKIDGRDPYSKGRYEYRIDPYKELAPNIRAICRNLFGDRFKDKRFKYWNDEYFVYKRSNGDFNRRIYVKNKNALDQITMMFALKSERIAA